ncbi:hypothetical protein ARTHRO8AJ_340002 [Arthrobacter sp. 8AJ]|nr:hypothetical protein ARTHRO8AJ_340002 [Arthrobacter sp. 8AJ]
MSGRCGRRPQPMRSPGPDIPGITACFRYRGYYGHTYYFRAQRYRQGQLRQQIRELHSPRNRLHCQQGRARRLIQHRTHAPASRRRTPPAVAAARGRRGMAGHGPPGGRGSAPHRP